GRRCVAAGGLVPALSPVEALVRFVPGLAGEGAGPRPDRAHAVGRVAWGTVGADAPCDLLGKITFQVDTRFQDGEQFDLGGTVTLGHVDDKSVDDLLQCQDGPVDLAGAHANTTAVDGGVGASVDDRGTAVGDLDPVTVPAGVGVAGEVAGPRPIH